MKIKTLSFQTPGRKKVLMLEKPGRIFFKKNQKIVAHPVGERSAIFITFSLIF